MRKYQQAAVTGVALVSSVLFLVYKHEYDRLRGVMEVMEVFGDPHGRNVSESVSAYCRASLPPVSLPDSAARYLLDTAGSAWQAVDQDLHVFSAHLVSRPHGGDEIIALGASSPLHFRSSVEATVSMMRRRVGHKGVDELKLTGTVQVLKTATGETDEASSVSKWEPILIKFPIRDDLATPRALRFSSGAGVPIVSEANTGLFGSRTHSPRNGRRTVCMFLPADAAGGEFPTLATAVAYYESAGSVREFWLYGQNELSFRDSGSVLPSAWESGLKLGALPWNFPFRGRPDRQRDLALADCALRADGQRHHSPGTLILVRPDEFVVPRIHHELGGILGEPKEGSPPLRVSFAATAFCPVDDSLGVGANPLEAEDGFVLADRYASVFQFGSALDFVESLVSANVHVKTRDVPTAVGALLVYPDSCSEAVRSGRKTTEMSLLKFKKAVETHEIFRHLRAFSKFL